MTDSTRREPAPPAQRTDDPTADQSSAADETTPRDQAAGDVAPGSHQAPDLANAETGAADGGGDEPPPGFRRSGLRNPAGAVRGMGAAALGLQGVVLLLAIQPIRVLGDGAGAAAVWTLVALTVVCFVLCGMMRRRWVWTAGTVVQILLLAGGFFHWTLFALGAIFTLVWLYVLYVRRSILG